MKRKIRLLFTVLSMLAVMLVFAAITLRIALHGHEVTVPDFAGNTITEASTAALRSGVDLSIENKFYSTTIPPGRVLAQVPVAGSRVRHGWIVRVSVSLGPQDVTIPDVVGQPVRDASVSIRRDQLDLGTIAHFDATGDPDMVLAQTPPPDAGVDQPRVSLLLSESGGSAAISSFVMPSFIGMSFPPANHAAIALGLRVAPVGEIPQAAPAPAAVSTAPDGTPLDANGQPIPKPAPVYPSGPVTAQVPDSGHRANRGDVLRLYFGSSHPPGAAPAATPATPTQ